MNFELELRYEHGLVNTKVYMNNYPMRVPLNARPWVYWWWINGYVVTIRLKPELISMKKAGIAGVDIFDIDLLLPVPHNRNKPLQNDGY